MSSLFNIMYHGDLADIEDHLEAGVELDASTLGALLTNIVRKVRVIEEGRKPRVKPDPDGQNSDRAAWAGEAIRAFQNETNCDFEDVLADLLCDLAHWADRNGFDFEAELARAQTHYDAETSKEGGL